MGTRAKTKKALWGEPHSVEALRRTFEIAAEFAAAGQFGVAWWLVPPSPGDNIAPSEELWREHLGSVGVDGKASIDKARIDREVRRVRALAEGRLVRTTRSFWMVGRVEVSDEAEARLVWKKWRTRGDYPWHERCTPKEREHESPACRRRRRRPGRGRRCAAAGDG